MIPRPAIDVSDMLKAGVYVLSFHERVVHVGRARCMLSAIADHRSAGGSKRLPEWFPIKAIIFDAIEIHPMSYDLTEDFIAALLDSRKRRYIIPIHRTGISTLRRI